jgi:hypothetical protein
LDQRIEGLSTDFKVRAVHRRRDRARRRGVRTLSEWRSDRDGDLGRDASSQSGHHAGVIFVTGGGLISHGPDRLDQYRRAAGYVDRILKGKKPADLPVQGGCGLPVAVSGAL